MVNPGGPAQNVIDKFLLEGQIRTAVSPAFAVTTVPVLIVSVKDFKWSGTGCSKHR